MTISNVYEKTIAPANGVTTMFPYAYPVLRDTNVVVNLVDNTTGVETLQTLNADYVVSSTPASSVTITFNVAPASGNSVTIDQNIPMTQTDVDMTEFGKFPSEVVEEGMDKLTMLAQQNSLGVKQAIRINPTLVDFTGTTDIKENAPDRANKVIGFDATGENIGLFVNSQDAYDEAVAAATAASQSASDAADSETNAANSEAAAIQAAADAEAVFASLPVDFVSWLFPTPTNNDYRVIINMPYDGTIKTVTTRCTSGTCTLTAKVNTTALGGSANSVSTTEQIQTHTTSNTFVAGDDIVITISANSSCINLNFTIAWERTV